MKLNSTTGDVIWAIGYGSVYFDAAYGVSVDSTGVYLTGLIHNAPFSNPEKLSKRGTFFVLKLNRDTGQRIWSMKGKGPYVSGGTGIVTTERGYTFMTVYFVGDVLFRENEWQYRRPSENIVSFYAKIDSMTGKLLWAKKLDMGYSTMARSIVVRGDQGYIIGSYQNQLIDNGKYKVLSSDTDVFLTGFQPSSGEVMFVDTIGSSGLDLGLAVALNRKNTVYALGTFKGSLTLQNSNNNNGGASSTASATNNTSTDIFIYQRDWALTCSGVLSNDPSVCSSHGRCLAQDECHCDRGWFGQNCESERGICFGVPSNSASVCSSHGECIRSSQCDCHAGWVGEDCSIPTCFGMKATDRTVCSGRGKCESVDHCVCNAGYAGHRCQSAKKSFFSFLN